MLLRLPEKEKIALTYLGTKTRSICLMKIFFHTDTTIQTLLSIHSQWTKIELSKKHITETQNHQSRKIPSRSSSQTVSLAPPSSPLNHILKCHSQTPLEHFQRQWISHFPGWLIPMANHSFSGKKRFLTSDLNLPWHNLIPCPLVLWTWDMASPSPGYLLLSGSYRVG